MQTTTITNWVQFALTSLIYVLPLFYLIKKWFDDKKEARAHDATQRELDRKSREKENFINMEKVFTILYQKANSEILESFKTFQNEYKKDFMEIIKGLKN